MHVLGKPIRVCPSHVMPLRCGCMGVELGEPEELQAATYPGCACCKMPPRASRPSFRVLRKCGRRGCYARFVVSALDDSFADEWLGVARRRLSRVVHPLRRAA